MVYDFNQEATRDSDGLLMAGDMLFALRNETVPNARYDWSRVQINFKPASSPWPYLFHWKPWDKIYYWMELEFSNMRNCEQGFAELRKKRGIENTIIRYHTDGSLSQWVEHVTSPMSKEFYLKYWMKWLENLTDDVRYTQGTTLNAWLHIHVTRTTETQTAVEKIRNYLLDNTNLWKKISWRQTATDYCRWDEHFSSHYNFFSTSSRHPTYEFRIFKATLVPETLSWRIQTFLLLMDWGMNAKWDESFINYLSRKEVQNEFPKGIKYLSGFMQIFNKDLFIENVPNVIINNLEFNLLVKSYRLMKAASLKEGRQFIRSLYTTDENWIMNKKPSDQLQLLV